MKKIIIALMFSNSVYASDNINTLNNDVNQSQNSTANVYANIDNSNNQKIPVNSAIAPNVYPTAPCMGSSSAGGGTAFISLSGGTSWESKECMLLEVARSFEQSGHSEDAQFIRCKSKYAEGSPSCEIYKVKDEPKNCVLVFEKYPASGHHYECKSIH